MKIDTLTLKQIHKSAKQVLNTTLIGGVSRDSAERAIRRATSDALDYGKQQVNHVQSELSYYRNNVASKMVYLTSQNDSLILSLEEAQRELNIFKNKNYKVKIHEELLPNGFKKIRKVTPTGTVINVLKNELNKTIEFTTKKIDGSINHTKMNPETGKPVSTFKNKDGIYVLINFDENGKAIKIKPVNAQKVTRAKKAIEKVELINESEPMPIKCSNIGESGSKIEREYSDGSSETLTTIMKDNDVVRTETVKRDKNDVVVYAMTKSPANKSAKLELFNPETKVYTNRTYQMEANGKVSDTTVETILDKATNEMLKIKAKFKRGDKTVTIKALQDEFGFYKPDEYKAAFSTNGELVKRLKGTFENLYDAFLEFCQK